MHKLAQLNIAQMKYDYDAPEMTGFIAQLDDINGLADRSPGFVWRWPGDGDMAAGEEQFGADVLFKLSVWNDLESLRAFVFKSNHGRVMTNRKQWFDCMSAAHSVLWWVSLGHIRTVFEALERLDCLRENGPTNRAFTFRDNFAAD